MIKNTWSSWTPPLYYVIHGAPKPIPIWGLLNRTTGQREVYTSFSAKQKKPCNFTPSPTINGSSTHYPFHNFFHLWGIGARIRLSLSTVYLQYIIDCVCTNYSLSTSVWFVLLLCLFAVIMYFVYDFYNKYII